MVQTMGRGRPGRKHQEYIQGTCLPAARLVSVLIPTDPEGSTALQDGAFPLAQGLPGFNFSIADLRFHMKQ